MPGFDGTGPRGMGPMTGGGRGFCNPYGVRTARRPYAAPRRAEYGYAFPAAATREQEIDFLKEEARALRRTLQEIDARVKELAGEGK